MTASLSSTPASCGQSDGTATATPNGGSSPYTYTWSSNFQPTQTATGLAAGTYSVIVADAGGCSQTFTASVGATGGPTVMAATNTIISTGSSVQLSATSSAGVSYSWSPATGLSCTNCSNPVATPNQTTIYCVYVTDAGGCSDSSCVKIVVEEPCTNHYYLPNAFSPNDDYENDVVKIYPPDVYRCIKEFKLSIYDRWGEKVFETTSPADTWDGIGPKGRVMNSQVVAYYLHIVFLDGTTEDKQGNISLIR
jgi:gliding motility-associated-like protein